MASGAKLDCISLLCTCLTANFRTFLSSEKAEKPLRKRIIYATCRKTIDGHFFLTVWGGAAGTASLFVCKSNKTYYNVAPHEVTKIFLSSAQDAGTFSFKDK